ncbi:hypothetical protein Ef18B233LT_44430 (plasmid) [Escherichia fergusonii]|nr:hypothetical protein Ef18B233LT_44430 [Escherichia fergusonii]
MYEYNWLSSIELVLYDNSNCTKRVREGLSTHFHGEAGATRALDTINSFAIERCLSICNYYIEDKSGSKPNGLNSSVYRRTASKMIFYW